MELTQLPRELQFYILRRLDGRSMLNAKQVCKLWLEIVGSLEKTSHFWLECCLNEIPKGILVQIVGLPELLTRIDVHECMKLEWTFWHDVYMDYERMGLVCDGQPQCEEISPAVSSPFNACTSLRLKDNIIVSGHTDGSVVLWNDGQYKLLTRHRSHVTEVEILNTVECMKDIEDWITGYQVISVSRDVNIHTSSPLTGQVHKLVHYSGSVNAVSCYGGRFVVAANSSILNGQPIWRVSKDTSVPPTITTTLYGHEESYISAVAIWDNEVISGDVIGNLFKWKIPKDGTDAYKPVHIAKFSVSFTKTIFYDGHVLICLLADGSICWKVGASKFKTLPNGQELEVFSATPVCMACRARLLAIGLNSGFVVIYFFPEEESWENFDPVKPNCSLKASQDSVNCVHIGDDGEGPVIITSSTNEGIKKFYWRPP